MIYVSKLSFYLFQLLPELFDLPSSHLLLVWPVYLFCFLPFTSFLTLSMHLILPSDCIYIDQRVSLSSFSLHYLLFYRLQFTLTIWIFSVVRCLNSSRCCSSSYSIFFRWIFSEQYFKVSGWDFSFIFFVTFLFFLCKKVSSSLFCLRWRVVFVTYGLYFLS